MSRARGRFASLMHRRPRAAAPMIVRAATPEDAPAIARVHVASWRSTYAGVVPQGSLDALDPSDREGMWRRLLPLEDRLTIVAELDGEVVGFCAVGPAREPERGHDAELYALYLLRERQGRGLGRVLFEEGAAWLHGQGLRRMALWVLVDNPSRGFYERMGGRACGERDDEVGGKPLRERCYEWALPLD